MGVFDRFRARRKPEPKQVTIPLGKDKNGDPITWDLTSEHHVVFVGTPKECLSARNNIEAYVRRNPLSWEYIPLFAPEPYVLQAGGQESIASIRDFHAQFGPIEKEIYEKIAETDEDKKSIILCIQHASFFSIREQDWSNEYPAIPYKAAKHFISKLQALMHNTHQEHVYIMLMDDSFHDYSYLASEYKTDFGLEIDENGFAHKVPF